jgi:ribose transport system substrate-binding protein
VLVGVALAVLSLTTVADASTEPPAEETAAEGTAAEGDFLTAAAENAAAHQQIPTEILTTDPVTPVEEATVYNIACDQSLVGCSVIAGYIKTGVEALGWTYELCDAGGSPQEATSCFDNAINAGADAIITNAVGVNVAGNGYAAAEEAGIPIAAIFSGNGEGAPGVVTEVGETACPEQGAIVADYIISSTEGNANTLFVTERSIGCNNQRTDGFLAAMEACDTCTAETLEFDRATMDANLPRQITAAIQANPDLNYIVGVFGAPTLISATAVNDSGRDISVAGLDGDPANIELIRQGDVMQAAIAFGRGEAAWAGVDAIARTLSGAEVPTGTAVPILLINDSNVDDLPADGLFEGPAGFEDQFKALWGVD